VSVRISRQGPAAVVTLDWPQKRNVLGPPQGRELTDALVEVGHDPDVKVVILTGNGAFSAGGDLTALRELAARGPAVVRDNIYGVFQKLITTLVGLPVPTIAAIDGPAIGIGLDVALACDHRIIGPDGWLAQGWAALGLIPGTGGVSLMQHVAPGALWTTLGSSERMTPSGAERLGLAVASSGGALSAAHVDADRLGRLPRATLTGYVELSRAELRERLPGHLEACLRLQVDLVASPDFLERTSRFASPTRPATVAEAGE
jgi:enoyl-CoA hydratase/carnithine racemase